MPIIAKPLRQWTAGVELAPAGAPLPSPLLPSQTVSNLMAGDRACRPRSARQYIGSGLGMLMLPSLCDLVTSAQHMESTTYH